MFADIFRKKPESGSGVQKDLELEHFPSLIASLCPALDIEVRTGIKLSQTQVVVSPDDWKSLSAAELSLRLYRETDRVSARRMVNLCETTGALVGRVAYDGAYGAQAVSTHRGLCNGTVPGLAGVVLGLNNDDLARSKSVPIASKGAWARWAEEWIGPSGDEMSVEDLAALHPLMPTRDFGIYRRGAQRMTAAELVSVLKSESEIAVCREFPDYDDYHDDVSRSGFEHYFEPYEDIVFLPPAKSALAMYLDFPRVDYAQRFEEILNAAWGGFDQTDIDDRYVGEVEGTKIERIVTCYMRLAENSVPHDGSGA